MLCRSLKRISTLWTFKWFVIIPFEMILTYFQCLFAYRCLEQYFSGSHFSWKRDKKQSMEIHQCCLFNTSRIRGIRAESVKILEHLESKVFIYAHCMNINSRPTITDKNASKDCWQLGFIATQLMMVIINQKLEFVYINISVVDNASLTSQTI